MAGLSDAEFQEIKDTVLRIDALIEREAGKRGLIHVDGKKEFGYDKDRKLMVVDTFGTLDEDRWWDADEYAKGNIERAYQRSQTVMLGTLVNADGTPMDDTILQTVQDAMTDYDRNWCKDMEDFFGRYTTNLINETSMKLLGYDRATVKNYYPIAVDRSTLATEIEGVKMDATIEGRGFLKERVKSDKPILLEECQNCLLYTSDAADD